MRKRVAHWLQPMGETRIPRLHLCLDTEAKQVEEDGQYTQTWRVGAGVWLRGYCGRGWQTDTRRHYNSPIDLWSAVNSAVDPGKRLVIWAHNMSYDLRISRALEFLPAMGFDIEQMALNDDASWIRFQSGMGTIIMVDSLSWLPAPLQRIANDLNTSKLPAPDYDAPTAEWQNYCMQDVHILSRAILEILEYLELQQLGPWRPTGAGQSHSALRARFLTHRPLVHDRVDVLKAERRAMWTGRAEAWKYGEWHDGPYVEYDMSLAYCQIAADSYVPCRLERELPPTGPLLTYVPTNGTTILAEVEVETTSECVPVEHNGHILWPVGKFTTTLWYPELQLLEQSNARVIFKRVWQYTCKPVLADMATWIIDELQASNGGLHPVVRRMLKHWGRAMVGRCALKYPEWETWAHSSQHSIALGFLYDISTGKETDMIQIGHDIKIMVGEVESPDSLPQIPGWIMSECRARLWHLMNVAGLDHVMYVDTDALIVDNVGEKRLNRAIGNSILWPMHVKGRYAHLDIEGPRQLHVNGERRWAGVPVRAATTDSGDLRAELFTSLRESMQVGRYDRVDVFQRQFHLDSKDPRRKHVDRGQTVPIHLGEQCSSDMTQ